MPCTFIEGAAGTKGLNGCKHAMPDPNVAQGGPEKVMLNGVVSLSEIRKACVQRPFGWPCLINEVAQGEEVMGCRLAGPEPSLCRAAQLVLFGPMHEAHIQNDGVQPVQGLPHCSGLVVCWVKSTTLLMNWGDQT